MCVCVCVHACVRVCVMINCHSVVTGVWILPATVSHPNAWLPVLSPPYSSGHRPLSLATPSPKRTVSLPPHPSLSFCMSDSHLLLLLFLLNVVFLSSSHSSTVLLNPISHPLISNAPVSPLLPSSSSSSSSLYHPHAPFLLK